MKAWNFELTEKAEDGYPLSVVGIDNDPCDALLSLYNTWYTECMNPYILFKGQDKEKFETEMSQTRMRCIAPFCVHGWQCRQTSTYYIVETKRTHP